MSAPLIIIDWGTTSFRAWLVGTDGSVRGELADGKGMRDLKREEFAGYCATRLAPWRHGGEPPPIYMAGMVGAPQGWRTAPQLPLPVTLDALAAQVMPLPDMPGASIIPGVRRQGGADAGDVMRGEEVQIFGALADAGLTDAILCLPGTHSKWARVEGHAITGFTTSMTGEVYDVMLEHSVLGLPAERGAPFAADAFASGLEQSSAPGGLLHHLFTTRARGLYGGLAPEAVESYLSGLLIGAEIAAMRPLYPEAAKGCVLLVCAPRLHMPYESAFHRAGLSCRWITARAASLRGIGAVAAHHRKILSPETSP